MFKDILNFIAGEPRDPTNRCALIYDASPRSKQNDTQNWWMAKGWDAYANVIPRADVNDKFAVNDLDDMLSQISEHTNQGQRYHWLEFWGHGEEGTFAIGDYSYGPKEFIDGCKHHNITSNSFCSNDRYGDKCPLIWFRTCLTAAGDSGERFMQEISDYLQINVYAHEEDIVLVASIICASSAIEIRSIWYQSSDSCQGEPTRVLSYGLCSSNMLFAPSKDRTKMTVYYQREYNHDTCTPYSGEGSEVQVNVCIKSSGGASSMYKVFDGLNGPVIIKDMCPINFPQDPECSVMISYTDGTCYRNELDGMTWIYRKFRCGGDQLISYDCRGGCSDCTQVDSEDTRMSYCPSNITTVPLSYVPPSSSSSSSSSSSLGPTITGSSSTLKSNIPMTFLAAIISFITITLFSM
eukprot:gene14539-17175_t